MTRITSLGKTIVSRACAAITVAILLSSCVGHQKPITTSVIQSKNCQAPCWNGLVPGVTKKEEALVYLSSIPLVNTSAITETFDERETLPTWIRWQMDGRCCGIAELEDNTVRIIRLNGEFNLEKIIQMYGEPDTLLVASGYMRWTIILMYRETGLVVSGAHYSSKGDSVRIGRNTRFTEVAFTNQEYLDNYLTRFYQGYRIQGDDLASVMQPWNGYGSYPAIGFIR